MVSFPKEEALGFADKTDLVYINVDVFSRYTILSATMASAFLKYIFCCLVKLSIKANSI